MSGNDVEIGWSNNGQTLMFRTSDSPTNRVIFLLIVLKHRIVVAAQWKRILSALKDWRDDDSAGMNSNTWWLKQPKISKARRVTGEGWLVGVCSWLPFSGQPAQPAYQINITRWRFCLPVRVWELHRLDTYHQTLEVSFLPQQGYSALSRAGQNRSFGATFLAVLPEMTGPRRQAKNRDDRAEMTVHTMGD